MFRELFQKKNKFESLKKLSNQEIKNKYSIEQLKALEKDWQKELEFNFKDENLSGSFIQYKDAKKDELREIEEFIHVFYDWLEEKIHEFEDQGKQLAAKSNKEKAQIEI